MDRVYRDRLRTLLSVDDLVDGVLRRVPNLDETFFIFTSDHGYHISHMSHMSHIVQIITGTTWGSSG